MAKFSLKILDKSGIILYEDSAETMANLVVNREYEPGDSIIVETSEQNIPVWLQVDDALGASFVYLTGNIHYTVPFDKARTNITMVLPLTGSLQRADLLTLSPLRRRSPGCR